MKISVIIPFYNEEENVDFVLNEVNDVLSAITADSEIIAVNDGSRDQTAAVLMRLGETIKALQVINFDRNRGKDAALFAGFRRAGGDVIITMDGDGQNDARDIPAMLPLLDRYDAVLGERVIRQDHASKKIVSAIAYFFRRVILGDDIRDTACALKVMKRQTLSCLLPVKGIHRFIPVFLKLAGFSYGRLPVNHRPRRKGVSKFLLGKFYFVAPIIDCLFVWWYKRNHIKHEA